MQQKREAGYFMSDDIQKPAFIVEFYVWWLSNFVKTIENGNMNLFTDTLSRILHRNGIPEDQMAFDCAGIWHVGKVSDGGNVFLHPLNTIKVLF